MIGMIQKVLLSLVEEHGGSELKAGTSFRIHTDYPDEQVHALFEASQAEIGWTRAQLMEHYAVHFIQYAESVFPRFFKMSSGVQDFLVRQPVIHASFAAGLTGQSVV